MSARTSAIEGLSGLVLLNPSYSHFDPYVWSGRALQEVSSIRQMRSRINVSGLRLEHVVLRAIMDISARAISLADRPRTGHSGHQCSHAPGRPILHLVSSSRRPRRVRAFGYVIESSSLRTVPLFVPGGRSFVPACACRRAARKGPSRLAVALALPLAPALPGHALTAPSTAQGSRRPGRHRISLDALEGAPLVENRPGDAGELVGKRNRQHVVVQSFFGGLNPRFEAIALPLL